MIRKRLRHISAKKKKTVKQWTNKLQNLPCFITACGPSLDKMPIGRLVDFFTIGINSSYLKIDPTILIWQDIEFYYISKRDLSRLNALKYCRDTADPTGTNYLFSLSNGGYDMPKDPSRLHGRGNTGALAFQLAYVLGCDPIILLGFDCKYEHNRGKGYKTDFYGINKFHNRNTLEHCRNALLWIKKFDKKRQIISYSRNDIFEKKFSLETIIEMVEGKYNMLGRDYFIGELFDNSLKQNESKEIKKDEQDETNPDRGPASS